MKRNKNQFPGIPRSQKTDAAQSSITENVELLTGARGKNRALLVSDLVNLDDMKRNSLIQSAKGSNTGGLPIVPGGGIERPHAPVNLQGTGGFTFIALTWDAPNYKGHAYAEIFRSDTDVFTDAVRIATEVTDIFSDSVNMGSQYYYWVRFVNKADMIGPTQGANGLYVETQQSAEQILAEIGGQIENSHLGDFLSSEVGKIPAISAEIYDVGGVVQTAKDNADLARESTESMALNLVNAALVGDLNWQNNSVKLINLESTLDSVKATITSEFYTRTEANEAIAATATTLRTEVEESLGISISGDLDNTFYTKANSDEAIALASTNLKAAIEDPLGASVGASLSNNYYTSTQADSAISAYGTDLKSSIEDPAGASLGATLYNGYYTKTLADEAIAAYGVLLKAEIEDPDGDGIAADFVLNYYSKVDTDSAIANSIYSLNAEFNQNASGQIENALANDLENEKRVKANAGIINQQQTVANETKALAENITLLTSRFNDADSSITRLSQTFANNFYSTAKDFTKLSTKYDNVDAELQNNFYTKSSADEAISNKITLLKTAIEAPDGTSIGADLYNNYYTKTTADEAISEKTTLLKTAIEAPDGSSIGADLYNNYYTKVTANEAVAETNRILKAEIEDADGASVGASLQTLSTTVANNDKQWAMWGVKTTVNDLTSSFGLVNDGVDPIFAIKGAKFAIITSQDPTNLTPVFAVVDGKTVMNEAVIDSAFIQSLVTDDLLSNRVTVGSVLQTPSINYDPTLGRSQNFSVDPNGNMQAKSAVLESVVIKDSLGNIVMSSTGAIPSTSVTGLGGLALLDALGYDSLSGKPTLGTFAALSSLGYDSLSGRPTLGAFAALDSLGYDSLSGKPTLGSLASQNSLGYDSLTGKPTLGSLASQNSLGYDSLTGKPTLGSLAALNSFAYNSLTGRPTLGTFAALNSLGYDSLTGKPTLGSLAALSSLAYDSVTGKPTLGPFAGLAKLLSTNVSTYIESGAIGSAQIDQAYIGTLFGANASFSGTVYAEQIEGDVVDVETYSYPSTRSITTSETFTLFSGSVAAAAFGRKLTFGAIPLHAILDPTSNDTATMTVTLKYYRGSSLIYTSPGLTFLHEDAGEVKSNLATHPVVIAVASSASATSFNVKCTVSRGSKHYSHPKLDQSQPCVVSLFKAGGALS
jgi:phosphoribosylformylglycinamidine (FGAM) synthase PurS component